jgi:hypothetical protein
MMVRTRVPFAQAGPDDIKLFCCCVFAYNREKHNCELIVFGLLKFWNTTLF